MKAPSSLLYLENDLLKASFFEYGASLVSLIYKPLNRECVCGFTDLNAHKKQNFYLGNIIGRVANRIENGKYSLNNLDYELDINASPHHLHGGKQGLSFVDFKHYFENDSLVFETKDVARSAYPGQLSLKIRYTLKQDILLLEFISTVDEDSLVDPTLHTYFNLNPKHSDSIRNHQLKVSSHSFYGVDQSGCTQSIKYDVEDIGFSTNKDTKLSKVLSSTHPQITSAKGLDHFFLRDPHKSHFIQLKVEDLSLSINTDLPGAHIYTGNYLEKTKELNADFLQENGGICFECHHVPNSINFDPTIAPILKANTSRINTIQYQFKEITNENK